jgi:hypothetical protein
MQIHIFKSETRKGLHAFVGDLTGSKLSQNHGPWTVTGVVGPDMSPPHNLSCRLAQPPELKPFNIDCFFDRKLDRHCCRGRIPANVFPIVLLPLWAVEMSE